MKFILGIIIGAAASGYLVNNMSAEQRRKLEAQIDRAGTKAKNSKVADSVKANVDQVVSDVSDVAAAKIDDVGDTVSDKVKGAPSTGD